VPKAVVRASSEVVFDFPQAKTSEPEGRFELRGLPAGPWRLEARSADLASDSVAVQLQPDQPVESVRLVLSQRREVAGLVVGPEGQGLPGVRVIGRLEQERQFLSEEIPEAYTDVDGQFKLRLPPKTEGVQLTVFPPGFAVTQVRVDARRGEPAVIPVRQVGGTVVLSYEDGSEPSRLPRRRRLSLFHEFGVGFLQALDDWARLHGRQPDEPGRFAVPMLEPGPYTACFDVGDLAFLSGRVPAGAGDRCASGELVPGSELVLTVPVPRDRDRRVR
jgi:hypothetical protein